MAGIILPCTCTHDFQDKTYGKGMRVHSTDTSKNKKLAYCTVCTPSHKDKQKEDIIPNIGMGIKISIKKRAPRNGKSY